MAEAPERDDAHALRVRAGLLYVALLGLGVGSVVCAFLFDGVLALALPLAASAVMSVLVGLRFMELPRAGAISLLSAMAGVLFLCVMFALTFADEFTRDHVPAGFGEEPR